MTIDRQQENLLFTLDFANLERRYIGTQLSPLEKELFRRCKELQEEQDNVDNILDNHYMSIETLDYDLDQMKDKSEFLQIDVDNLKDELKEKNEEIDNLKYELKELQSTTTLDFS